jgi:hypothetical protein
MLINDQLHVFHHEYMLIQYDDVLDHIYVVIQDKISQLMDHQAQCIPKKKLMIENCNSVSFKMPFNY